MLAFLNNNFYLSLIIGLAIGVINYGLNKNEKSELSMMDTLKKNLKLALVSALLIYIGFYIRTKTFDLPKFGSQKGGSFVPQPSLVNNVPSVNQLNNVHIGEPNF